MKPELLAKIFAKQAEKAMEGDTKAAKFIFDQARAFSEVKGITLVQNIYQDGARPEEPPAATHPEIPNVPPSRQRVASGNGMFRADGSRIKAG